MGRVKIPVSVELVNTIMREGLDGPLGFDLPDDASLVFAFFDDVRNWLVLVVESETFPPMEPGALELPILNPTVRRIYADNS